MADTIPSAPPAADQTWTTDQLREEFVVQGFSAGLCVVKRKSDGLVGSLDFGGYPRIYHSFVAHDGPECGNGIKP